MDRNKIINEGLLTPYLLGSLNEEQRVQIAEILNNDPELKGKLRQLEIDFERLGMENAITPPASVLEGLKGKMEGDNGIRVIPMSNIKRINAQLKTRLFVAASLAALFALGSFWFYTQWQDASNNMEDLQLQTADLKERINSLEGNLQLATERYLTITDPDAIPVILEGNEKLPNSRAIAYLNRKTREVVVNSKGLPPLETDKTYQMWADVDGVMVNMGLLPSDEQWVELAYIDRAESLNITIEPAGGNDHPTVENLISNVLL